MRSREDKLKYCRDWHYAHKGIANTRSRDYYYAHKVESKTRDRENRQKVKKTIIDHYGGECSCCGEKKLAFLTIDHINGNGTAHRKETGGGANFHRWLIRNDFPSGYQVLCFNCNCGKVVNGGVCPHKDALNVGILFDSVEG